MRNRDRWLRRSGKLLGVGSVTMLALLAGCQPEASTDPSGAAAGAATLTDDAAKAAYSLGYRSTDNVAETFGDAIDVEAFLQGARDRLAGTDSAVDIAEGNRVLGALLEARSAAERVAASETLEAGLRFLEENGKREGVISLPSGLQYEVLAEGAGDKPVASDEVTTHYEGTLIDGTVFDSSRERGEPVTFPLNRVIPGWTEGLQLMAPGARYRLYVPSELAYGDQEVGGIPANSTLIFDVELISVQHDEADAAAEAGAQDAE